MRQVEEFVSVSDDKETLLATAKAMGLRASRDHLGAVTLELPAASLPPKLREFSEKIAETTIAPSKTADLLVRTMLWAKRRGHSIDEVLREAAGEVISDPETIEAISVAMDREALLSSQKPDAAAHFASIKRTTAHLQPSPVSMDTAPKAPNPEVRDELDGYLSILAKQTSDVREGTTETPFLERLRTGGYAPPPPITIRDFADFVRRVSASIDRAIKRHGETPRLRGLRSMIDAIRASGITQYEREDPARAARLLALGPRVLDQLEDYAPNPGSALDRPLQPELDVHV